MKAKANEVLKIMEKKYGWEVGGRYEPDFEVRLVEVYDEEGQDTGLWEMETLSGQTILYWPDGSPTSFRACIGPEGLDFFNIRDREGICLPNDIIEELEA